MSDIIAHQILKLNSAIDCIKYIECDLDANPISSYIVERNQSRSIDVLSKAKLINNIRTTSVFSWISYLDTPFEIMVPFSMQLDLEFESLNTILCLKQKRLDINTIKMYYVYFKPIAQYNQVSIKVEHSHKQILLNSIQFLLNFLNEQQSVLESAYQDILSEIKQQVYHNKNVVIENKSLSNIIERQFVEIAQIILNNLEKNAYFDTLAIEHIKKNSQTSIIILSKIIERALNTAKVLNYKINAQYCIEATFLNFKTEFNSIENTSSKHLDELIYNTDYKNDKDKVNNNISPQIFNRIKPGLSKEQRIKQYLDKYEKAAIELLKLKLPLVNKNMAQYCSPPMSPPAISDAFKKQGKNMKQLLKSHPNEWPTIRTHFKPIRSLLDQDQILQDSNN